MSAHLKGNLSPSEISKVDGFSEKAGSASHEIWAERSWRPLVAEEAIPTLGTGCSGRCSVRGDPESLQGQKHGKRPTKRAGE